MSSEYFFHWLQLLWKRKFWYLPTKAAIRRCSILKLLKESLENTCTGVYFPLTFSCSACNFTKKEASALVYFRDLLFFFLIFQNTTFYGIPRDNCFYTSKTLLQLWNVNNFCVKNLRYEIRIWLYWDMYLAK